MNTKYEFHDLASAFPMLDEIAYKELVKDVQERGLKVPIVLYDGKILDGRNRYKACLETGTTPKFETYSGPDALGASYSYNAVRRHLTPDQKKRAVEFKLVQNSVKSNGAIAKEIKVTEKTVAAVRKTLEAAKAIPVAANKSPEAKEAAKAAGAAGGAAGAEFGGAGGRAKAANAKGGRPPKTTVAPKTPKPEPYRKPTTPNVESLLVDPVWGMVKKGQIRDQHMAWFHSKDTLDTCKPPGQVRCYLEAMNWIGVRPGTQWDVVEGMCRSLISRYHESKPTSDPHKLDLAVKSFDMLRKCQENFKLFSTYER